MEGSHSRACLLLLWLAALGGPLGPPFVSLQLPAGALPLQEGEEPYPWEWEGNRSAGCEACQAVVELLLSPAISVGGSSSSSSSFAAAGIGSLNPIPLSTISLEKETREEAEQWLKRRQQAICSGGLMQLYAEQTETLYEGALSAACDSLFQEKRETLLRLFYAPQQPPVAAAEAAAAAAAAELCLPSPCESLWGEEDSPWGRLPQSLRNLRDSELFLSLNLKNNGVERLKSGLQIRWIHRRPEETPDEEDEVNRRASLSPPVNQTQQSPRYPCLQQQQLQIRVLLMHCLRPRLHS
ncbi:hypothetical protein Emag_005322 [Eimeria magna]